MVTSEDNKKILSINCEKLEEEIDNAINEYLPESLPKKGRFFFKFITKPIKWCLRLLELMVSRFFDFSKPVFDFDSKGTNECKYIQKFAEIKLSYYTNLLAIIILFIALGISYFITFFNNNIYSSVGGAIIAVISFLALSIVFPKYSIYCRLVLDAEERILSEDSQNKPTQRTD